jgi:phage shock protein C
VNDRLYRSRHERVIAGVAGGVAQRFDIDPSLVRVGWVILALLTGGVFLLLYIVMAIVVPEAPAGTDQWAAWQPGPGPGAMPDWGSPGADQGPGPSVAAAGASVGPSGAATEGLPGESIATDAPTGPASETGGPSPAERAGAGATGWASQGPGGPPPWGIPPRRHDRHERSGAGPVVIGLILVLVGVYFLLRTFVPDLDLGPFWPVILIVIGGALLVGSIRPGSGGGSTG